MYISQPFSLYIYRKTILMSTNRILFFVILLFSLGSCVSTAKFSAIEDENKRLKLSADELIDLRQKYAETAAMLESKSRKLTTAEQQINVLENKIATMQENYAVLQSDFNLLSSQNNVILNSSSQQRSDLERKLSEKQVQLDKQQRLLTEKKDELDKQRAILSEQESTIQQREEQISTLNSNLLEQRRALLDLRNEIITALQGFSSDELQVEQKKDGKVYVSLSQQLLFKKGSDVIDSKGKEAIQTLAEVLKGKEMAILIEGHTDSDGSAARNWDLSVTRATAVVKILEDSGVDPKRLTASGKALYSPKVENTTEDQKAINRRTEIILSPKLDKIYELINKTK